MLPDLDVLGFNLGVAYGSPFGHRGFSHSLCFALALALFAAGFYRTLGTRFLTAWASLFIAIASHGMLDACTDGGSGIAFLWPFSDARYFMPFQVIEVSPLGVARFLSERGFVVLISELVWVWSPAIVFAALLAVARRRWLGRPLSVD